MHVRFGERAWETGRSNPDPAPASYSTVPSHETRLYVPGGDHGLALPPPVLSWRVSNTLEADFCVVALEEAIGRYGKPDIFNTDQGSQFTSLEFTGILKDNQIAIFMDGKGRWMDNVFIERLWWSLKYEYIYLNDFNGGMELKTGVGSWIDFYNFERGHSSLDDRTPNEVYVGSSPTIPGHAQGWYRDKKAA